MGDPENPMSKDQTPDPIEPELPPEQEEGLPKMTDAEFEQAQEAYAKQRGKEAELKQRGLKARQKDADAAVAAKEALPPNYKVPPKIDLEGLPPLAPPPELPPLPPRVSPEGVTPPPKPFWETMPPPPLFRKKEIPLRPEALPEEDVVVSPLSPEDLKRTRGRGNRGEKNPEPEVVIEATFEEKPGLVETLLTPREGSLGEKIGLRSWVKGIFHKKGKEVNPSPEQEVGVAKAAGGVFSEVRNGIGGAFGRFRDRQKEKREEEQRRREEEFFGDDDDEITRESHEEHEPELGPKLTKEEAEELRPRKGKLTEKEEKEKWEEKFQEDEEKLKEEEKEKEKKENPNDIRNVGEKLGGYFWGLWHEVTTGHIPTDRELILRTIDKRELKEKYKEIKKTIEKELEENKSAENGEDLTENQKIEKIKKLRELGDEKKQEKKSLQKEWLKKSGEEEKKWGEDHPIQHTLKWGAIRGAGFLWDVFRVGLSFVFKNIPRFLWQVGKEIVEKKGRLTFMGMYKITGKLFDFSLPKPNSNK